MAIFRQSNGGLESEIGQLSRPGGRYRAPGLFSSTCIISVALTRFSGRLIPKVLLRKLHSKQSACFMVFTKRPIYRGFATSDRSQNDSKMNFAMEPCNALHVVISWW